MKNTSDNEHDALCVVGSSTPLLLLDDGDKDEVPFALSNPSSDAVVVDDGCSTTQNGDGGGTGDDESPNGEAIIHALHAINKHDNVHDSDADADYDIGNSGNAFSPCSPSLKSDETNNNIARAEYYSNEDNSFYSDDEDDDMSLGFPPGHITRMEELNILQNHNRHPIVEKQKSSINPLIIPTYFFCPLTKTIMRDPVITPDGNTYERRAILRSLILEDCDPISRTPLSHEELTEDFLVRQAIQKARVEAWTRYAIEFKDESNNIMTERKSANNELIQSYHEIPTFFLQRGDMMDNLNKDTSSNSSFVRHSSSSSSSSIDDSTSVNHGWSVPLGVHKVICSEPGLVVTTDIHRRSNIVQRKILLKSLVEKNKKTDVKMIHLKRKNRKNHPKTITTVVTRDLIIPPGSFVDVVETCVHGGRIRGRIVWEEELKTENDLALSMRLAELKLRKNAAIRPVKPSNSPRKGRHLRTFFHRKSSSGTAQNYEHHGDQMSSMPHEEGHSRSLSPVTTTTIEYTGWISLQWEESSINHERDEARKRRERCSLNQQTTSLLATDDRDEGPWSQPIPLGVYRVCGDSSMDDTYAGNHDVGKSAKQMPMYDASDCKNIVDFLVPYQCIEILETKILVRKQRNDQDMIDVGRQEVLARCIVPTIIAMENRHNSTISQRTFRQGWVTLYSEGRDLVCASPVALGAYIVTVEDPIMSYDANSTIKSFLPPGSVRYNVVCLFIFLNDDSLSGCLSCENFVRLPKCIEVVNTRIEFEEDAKKIRCGCGKERMYTCVSVRALIASGGYVTLFNTSVGTDGVCVCGNLIQQETFADRVPLGTYRITHPTTLTKHVGLKTEVITQLTENSCIEVMDTKVEDGCVRGLVNISSSELCHDEEGSEKNDAMMTGWVCLFESPSFSWAEHILCG